MPVPTGIDEARGGVDQETETAEAAVVSGDERLRDEEQTARRGHLDTPDGNARDLAHADDSPELAAHVFLGDLPMPEQTEGAKLA